MEDKKIGGFGYYCSLLRKHVGIDFFADKEGKEYLMLDGFKSRKVADIHAVDERGNLVVWDLVEEIEGLLRELNQKS